MRFLLPIFFLGFIHPLFTAQYELIPLHSAEVSHPSELTNDLPKKRIFDLIALQYRQKKFPPSHYDYYEAVVCPHFIIKHPKNPDRVIGTMTYTVKVLGNTSHYPFKKNQPTHAQLVRYENCGFIWDIKENRIRTLEKDTIVLDMNDLGQVLCQHERKLFLYQNGTYSPVEYSFENGQCIHGSALNNTGMIIGYLMDKVDRAVLIENGKAEYLNDLLVNGEGWNVYEANDINDQGDIVGAAVDPMRQHRAVLLRRLL